jgi:hypothetical protein
VQRRCRYFIKGHNPCILTAPNIDRACPVGKREWVKRELGDIIWYWTNACRSLGLDPNDVIAENVNKLESRYPGGKFDAFYSENRKEGDL